MLCLVRAWQIPNCRSTFLAGNIVADTATCLNMFWAVWLSHICCYGGYWRVGRGLGSMLILQQLQYSVCNLGGSMHRLYIQLKMIGQSLEGL